jgi:hypothetical protein
MGSCFSGVITRTAAPAWISARAVSPAAAAPTQALKTSHRRNMVDSPLGRNRQIARPPLPGCPYLYRKSRFSATVRAAPFLAAGSSARRAGGCPPNKKRPRDGGLVYARGPMGL